MAGRRTPWGQNKPILGAQPNPAAVADLGLVFALLGNEAGGTVIVDPIANIVGTLNTINWTAGNFGSGFSFGASSADNITGTGINLANSSFSVGWWMNTQAANYFNCSRTIFGLGSSGNTNSSINMGPGGNGAINLSFFADDKTLNYNNTTFQNSQNVWACFVVTFNILTLVANLYINGVFASTVTMNAAFTGNTAFSIGNRADSSGSGSAFLLDHLWVSNQTLTLDQVIKLYTDPFWWMQPASTRTYFKSTASPVFCGEEEGVSVVTRYLW